MRHPVSVRDVARNIFATALSAAMLYFGTGLHPIWWLTWLAPLPVLLISAYTRPMAAFGFAALAWFVGGLNFWHYLHDLIGLPTPILLLIFLEPAFLFGVAVLIYRTFVRRGAVWLPSLCIPAVWVSLEYLMSVNSPHSTFGSVAYSQMDFLPVIQLASFTGVSGITFCLFLLPSATASLISGRGSRAERNTLAAVVAGLFVAVIGFGSWRLHSAPAVETSVRIALLASDEHQNIFPDTDARAIQLLAKYHQRIREAERGLIFVLPEKIAIVSDDATVQIDTLFKEVADHANASIVTGLDRGTQTRRWNEARVYSPGGKVRAYDKHHMIPGIEDVDQPGTTRTVWREPFGVLGVQICKDMDFPALSRHYGRDGVGLLLVPAWDFNIDGWLHGRMAIMRGVESGFTIARTAKQGLLTISDNRGRVLAERSSAAAPFSMLLASAPVAHSDTIYARCGDWFAWLNIAALLAIIATALLQRSRSASAR